MKLLIGSLLLLCLVAAVDAQSSKLDEPLPATTRVLLERADKLAGEDRLDQAVQVLVEARKASPESVEVHRQYLNLKMNFLAQHDAVRSEYEALMVQEPKNPVYQMAVALTLDATGHRTMSRYQKVVELAPDWSWSHFCRAYLVLGRTFVMVNENFGEKGDKILGELNSAIDANPRVADFYTTAIFFQKAMGRLDQAIETAARMTNVPELQTQGLYNKWDLQLSKAKGSETGRQTLKSELEKLSTTRDTKLLAVIYEAYKSILEDETSANAVGRRIKLIDRGWYPQRGKAVARVTTSASGSPYLVVAANRQFAIDEKIREVTLRREADWRKEQRLYLDIVALRPNTGLQRWLYTILFARAREAGDTFAMTRYANLLASIDPNDAAPWSRLALQLAKDKTKLRAALTFAQKAEKVFSKFEVRPCPAGIPAERCEQSYSAARQEEIFKRQRALALDAHGWTLAQLGQTAEAETKLREALALNRTDSTLNHLAEVLIKLSKQTEADSLLKEIDERLRVAVREQFTNEPAKDFTLTTLDGRSVKLSELKGKVVLLNFWATWCGPCIAEMPLLKTVYEENRGKGFELLAISGDDAASGDQVRRFSKEHRLTFPVFHDEATAKLYNVLGYPGNVLIDRDGRIKYVTGAFPEDGKLLRLVIAELMK